MAPTEPMDLDERKAAILRAVVEEYVETAEPVGSQRVAGSRKLGVSSATVRNDMTVLEREGYITQPYTSAGRIPTDLGYRYFVDHFTSEGALRIAQRRAVAEFFESAHRALEDLLHETSQLLSRVTDHTAMVVGPQPEVAQVRGVQLVTLHPGVVLAVAVLSNGAVEKETVVLDHDVSEDDVSQATARLSQHLLGSTFAAISGPAPRPGRAARAGPHRRPTRNRPSTSTASRCSTSATTSSRSTRRGPTQDGSSGRRSPISRRGGR